MSNNLDLVGFYNLLNKTNNNPLIKLLSLKITNKFGILKKCTQIKVFLCLIMDLLNLKVTKYINSKFKLGT